MARLFHNDSSRSNRESSNKGSGLIPLQLIATIALSADMVVRSLEDSSTSQP
jgi:hypothetical protein